MTVLEEQMDKLVECFSNKTFINADGDSDLIREVLLSRSGQKWRQFCQKNGPVVTKALLFKTVNDAIKNGRIPTILAGMLVDVLSESSNVQDLDVLLRLEGKR